MTLAGEIVVVLTDHNDRTNNFFLGVLLTPQTSDGQGGFDLRV